MSIGHEYNLHIQVDTWNSTCSKLLSYACFPIQIAAAIFTPRRNNLYKYINFLVGSGLDLCIYKIPQ